MQPLSRRGVTPEQIYTSKSLFEDLPVRSIVVTHKEIIDSEYNSRHCRGAERIAYETLEELVAQVETAVKSGGERKFIYAYWPQFDALSHQHGVGSAEVRAHFDALDHVFGEMLAQLAGTDTMLVLTADHGFIDCPAEESVELPAELSAMLRFPLCGERRIAFCHVHDQKSFIGKATALLGDRATVRPSRELLDEGWFGPGRPHARFAERIGDVALVMKGRATVKDWVPGEPRHLHIGNHGGTSDDEMHIPLVVAKT